MGPPVSGDLRTADCAYAFSAIGLGEAGGGAAHQLAQRREALVGNAHRRTGERHRAGRLVVLVIDDGGDAAQAERMLLIVDGVAPGTRLLELLAQAIERGDG